jgi:hypothetical protein
LNRRGCGGTGRRAGFRTRWASALGGSSPLARITFLRDAFAPGNQKNRAAVDAAAALPPLTGPISPELVLVSPPEVARLARIHLPSATARPLTAIETGPRVGEPGAVELAAVWTFCLAMTLGPVLFLLALNG